LVSAVDPEATPVKVPMAPTLKGVPLALPVAPALVLAAALADVLAGALLELDDDDEQPDPGKRQASAGAKTSALEAGGFHHAATLAIDA